MLVTLLTTSGSKTVAADLFAVRMSNGLPGGNAVSDGAPGKGLTVGQAMLWKYTARCALRADQTLEAPDAETGKTLTFRGMLGIAPEWHDGTCNADCQEKVSSCLIALTNRTGKHVELSLLSAATGMNEGLLPNAHDVDFPHQEGAFFGSVFSGVAYACHGHGVAKAPQVKRFCAHDPTSCSGGVATFTDAGACVDVCQMACTRLPDGSERCAATTCKDPTGHTWRFPITTYLRNKIEAVNADEMTNVAVQGDVLTEWKAGATVTYRSVDFGGAAQVGITTFAAGWAAKQVGGRLEVWLDGTRLLGTVALTNTRVAVRENSTRLAAEGVRGPHDLVLKVRGAPRQGRLSTIELR
ncbi:MAG TPA: carbohydrate-binding protein [Polyangia bacterium]|nr:carbohydrate-binding protein [Polyangia bacterium]